MAEYYIPTKIAEAEFVEKRSRFIGNIWPIESEEEARALQRELLAVTAVSGNYPVEITSVNARKVLELLGRQDIPAARGMARPMVRPARARRRPGRILRRCGKSTTTAAIIAGPTGCGRAALNAIPTTGSRRGRRGSPSSTCSSGRRSGTWCAW